MKDDWWRHDFVPVKTIYTQYKKRICTKCGAVQQFRPDNECNPRKTWRPKLSPRCPKGVADEKDM